MIQKIIDYNTSEATIENIKQIKTSENNIYVADVHYFTKTFIDANDEVEKTIASRPLKRIEVLRPIKNSQEPYLFNNVTQNLNSKYANTIANVILNSDWSSADNRTKALMVNDKYPYYIKGVFCTNSSDANNGILLHFTPAITVGNDYIDIDLYANLETDSITGNNRIVIKVNIIGNSTTNRFNETFEFNTFSDANICGILFVLYQKSNTEWGITLTPLIRVGYSENGRLKPLVVAYNAFPNGTLPEAQSIAVSITMDSSFAPNYVTFGTSNKWPTSTAIYDTAICTINAMIYEE